jgi:hypothetical protein
VTQNNPGASSIYGNSPPWSIAWGCEPMYGVFVARHAHPCCPSEKGKPVVRRGRKAYGPPPISVSYQCVWEAAGSPNGAAGRQSSALMGKGRKRMAAEDHKRGRSPSVKRAV